MTNTFTAIAIISSPGNAPVEVRYATGVSAAQAIAACATILADHEVPDLTIPASVRTRLHGVRIDATS